jgi:hypothetical protein
MWRFILAQRSAGQPKTDRPNATEQNAEYNQYGAAKPVNRLGEPSPVFPIARNVTAC